MWLYVAIGAIAGVPLILAAVGLLIPRGHVSARRARFARPPQAVWDVIIDLAAAPSWRRGLNRVEVGPPVDGKVSFVEHAGRDRLPFIVDESVAPRRRVLRILDAGMPFGGRWIFDLQPDGDGTRLTITEDGFIRNPIFRTLSRTVFSTATTLERYLVDLGAHFGETTTPSVVTPAGESRGVAQE